MDLEDFQRQVDDFAWEIGDLLDTCLPNETEIENPIISTDNFKASFKATKQLEIKASSRASLSCSYHLCTNSSGRHLAVETSSFTLSYRANSRPVPIVRFEYDRTARNKPASHFHFHADSVPLGLLLARGGNHQNAAQQHNVHFPMGGHRYRVCLEDLVELVIREFNATALDGWETRVKAGRDSYTAIQEETIIRKNIPTALKILQEQGFEVHPPDQHQTSTTGEDSEC